MIYFPPAPTSLNLSFNETGLQEEGCRYLESLQGLCRLRVKRGGREGIEVSTTLALLCSGCKTGVRGPGQGAWTSHVTFCTMGFGGRCFDVWRCFENIACYLSAKCCGRTRHSWQSCSNGRWQPDSTRSPGTVIWSWCSKPVRLVLPCYTYPGQLAEASTGGLARTAIRLQPAVTCTRPPRPARAQDKLRKGLASSEYLLSMGSSTHSLKHLM